MLTSLNPRVAGMVAMLAAVALFAAMDTALKILSAHYPAAQVAALRGLVSLPIVLVWSVWAGGVRPLVQVRWPLHLVRGALSIIMMITFSFGMQTLSLSEAYAIFFVSPLVATLFSMWVFGDRVQPVQWVAIGLGFVGVVIVLKPQSVGFVTAGGLAMLVCAICYSMTSVLVRLLGRTDSTYAMMFWMTTMLAVGATLIALPVWIPIRTEDSWLLLLVAVAGSLAQYCITVAFQRAPAASVAPLEYTALAWGAAIDFVIWHAVPPLRVFAGAGIVIVSGMLLLRHEARRGAGH
jgi:drug/metabolite transporter (DMT)-like permease